MMGEGHEAWILTPSSPRAPHFLAPDELAQKSRARMASTPAMTASANPIVKFMSPSFLTPLS